MGEKAKGISGMAENKEHNPGLGAKAKGLGTRGAKKQQGRMGSRKGGR